MLPLVQGIGAPRPIGQPVETERASAYPRGALRPTSGRLPSIQFEPRTLPRARRGWSLQSCRRDRPPSTAVLLVLLGMAGTGRSPWTENGLSVREGRTAERLTSETTAPGG